MKASDIREKTQEELANELAALKTELFRLRFQFATNQLDNPMKLKEVKKDIARVNTVIRERELISRMPQAGADAKASAHLRGAARGA